MSFGFPHAGPEMWSAEDLHHDVDRMDRAVDCIPSRLCGCARFNLVPYQVKVNHERGYLIRPSYLVDSDHSSGLWRMRMAARDVSLVKRINEELGSLRYAMHGIQLRMSLASGPHSSFTGYPPVNDADKLLPPSFSRYDSRGTVTLRSAAQSYDNGQKHPVIETTRRHAYWTQLTFPVRPPSDDAAVICWSARDQVVGIQPPELGGIADTPSSTLLCYFRLGIYMQELPASYAPPEEQKRLVC
ncbi:hypothetical protein BKA83DRAFT_9384 [Pisolithus microcarpus]|nr:hypothetical protein BKA83DRAFT_9384 [Pisolithus microcarpus]